jgi:hypothetical protein
MPSPADTLDAVLPHVRAALVAAVGAAMLILGTPGLDQFDNDQWSSGEDRVERQSERFGRFAVLAADFNRVVRMPVVRMLQPLQRPLRIAQSWALYPRGPAKIRRFELAVDGVVVYRSNDPQADWLGEALRYRRIRPIVASWCFGRSKSAEGLLAWIATRAKVRFHASQTLEIRCTIAPFPGTAEPTVTKRTAMPLQGTP